MTFQEYCASKKIDSSLFEKGDHSLFRELESVYVQMHPDSFTSQKKFLLNGLRKKYQLTEVEQNLVKPVLAKPSPKPIIGKKQEENIAPKPKVIIPKPNNNSAEAVKPKPIIPKPKLATIKPVIPGVTKKDDADSGVASLKPKIPSTSRTKPLALKPKIKPKNKD